VLQRPVLQQRTLLCRCSSCPGQNTRSGYMNVSKQCFPKCTCCVKPSY